jgi:hypothetical protein
MIQSTKETFVILDALDECTERRKLLDWLKELFTTSDQIDDLSHIRLLVTGRPEEELLSFIPRWIGGEHCLPLSTEAVNADIRSYVATRVERDFKSKRHSQELVEQIHNRVGNGADGMSVSPLHIHGSNQCLTLCPGSDGPRAKCPVSRHA